MKNGISTRKNISCGIPKPLPLALPRAHPQFLPFWLKIIQCAKYPPPPQKKKVQDCHASEHRASMISSTPVSTLASSALSAGILATTTAASSLELRRVWVGVRWTGSVDSTTLAVLLELPASAWAHPLFFGISVFERRWHGETDLIARRGLRTHCGVDALMLLFSGR